jgi:SAM-dependent methyltransferase
MSAPELIFDTALHRLRKARAARMAVEGARQGRPAPDFLLQRVAEELAWRLDGVGRRFECAIDLGAHHGVIGRRLRSLDTVGRVIDVEASPELLHLCSGERVLADPEALPFKDASLDLVLSGFTFQSLNDLPGTLVQIRRALRPDGLLLASMLGGATLYELREAFLVAEAETADGASPRVAPFADIRDLGGLLQRAGFALPVTDVDTVRVTYASPLALMHELRAMGAGNVLIARSRQPLRRATLQRAIEVYRQRFGTADGRIPATFEIVTLTGWAPDPSQQKPLAPGSARMRLADALGTTEQSTGEPAGVAVPGKRERDR